MTCSHCAKWQTSLMAEKYETKYNVKRCISIKDQLKLTLKISAFRESIFLQQKVTMEPVITAHKKTFFILLSSLFRVLLYMSFIIALCI